MKQPQPAARLVGAAQVLRETIGAPRTPTEKAKLDESATALRSLLGDDAYAKACFEGQSLTLTEAIELALASLNDN